MQTQFRERRFRGTTLTQSNQMAARILSKAILDFVRVLLDGVYYHYHLGERVNDTHALTIMYE